MTWYNRNIQFDDTDKSANANPRFYLSTGQIGFSSNIGRPERAPTPPAKKDKDEIYETETTYEVEDPSSSSTMKDPLKKKKRLLSKLRIALKNKKRKQKALKEADKTWESYSCAYNKPNKPPSKCLLKCQVLFLVGIMSCVAGMFYYRINNPTLDITIPLPPKLYAVATTIFDEKYEFYHMGGLIIFGILIAFFNLALLPMVFFLIPSLLYPNLIYVSFALVVLCYSRI
jgi:hypothetical protein